ncbi:MAG: cytochrome P450 [Alphaproteobacteria bacterium]|nr:cytochrome P450 [Alphaproteobacteria bacterium]
MEMKQELAEAIVNPANYKDFEKIHAVFTELRQTAPVALAKPKGFEPFWFISKFEDVQAVEADNETFHAGDQPTVLVDAETNRLTIEEIGSPHRFLTLVQMDGEKHKAYRDLTASWFGPRSLRNLEPRIRNRMQQTLDAIMATGGECDFARDIALLYPLRVIMDVLGVEDEAEELMLRFTQEVFGSSDAEANATGRSYATPEEQQQAISEISMEAFGYFSALTESRRKEPKDDLASLLSNGTINGAPLGEVETFGYYVITATAGHDTTSNSTSAGMIALCEQPELLKRLQDDPSLIPGFVEESIRWESPVKHFMRSATRDTQIRGIDIKKDEWMMSNFASASRDEDVYENPFEFDVTRKPNRHMALGYGPHVCLGQHLARLEMRIFWEELLPRLKSVEMIGPAKRVGASFVSGPFSVPIKFELQG